MKLKKFLVIGISLITMFTMSLSVYAREADNYSRVYALNDTIRAMGSIQANYTSDKNYYAHVLGTNRLDIVGNIPATQVTPTYVNLTVTITGLGETTNSSMTEETRLWPVGRGYITQDLVFRDGQNVWCITGEYITEIPELDMYLNPPDTNLSLGG